MPFIESQLTVWGGVGWGRFYTVTGSTTYFVFVVICVFILFGQIKYDPRHEKTHT